MTTLFGCGRSLLRSLEQSRAPGLETGRSMTVVTKIVAVDYSYSLERDYVSLTLSLWRIR